MAIALVTNVTIPALFGSPSTSSAINTTGASLLIVVASNFSSDLYSPTDSKGNTYTSLTRVASVGNTARIWYCANPTVGSGHTFTLTRVNDLAFGISGCAAAFSGVATTSPFDVENGTATYGASGVTGSVTPSNDNELILAGVGFWTGGTPAVMSINSSMSITDQVVDSNANSTSGSALAYFVQGTAAAINPTWTSTVNPTVLNAFIASFKAAAASGGGPIVRGGSIMHGTIVRGGRIAA